MEVQSIEFTVEQLLDLHRYWITELFIVDKKSEEEIVNLLHIHQINVTPHTLHSYLSNWNLLTPRAYDPKSWSVVPNADQLLSIQENDDIYSTVSTPLSYKQHSSSLLTTPISIAPIFTTIIDATATTFISDNHFPLPASPPFQPTLEGLDTIPNGLKPIEFYSLDLQDHERRVVDLESPQELWGKLKEKRKSELESSSTQKVKRVTIRNRDHGKK